MTTPNNSDQAAMLPCPFCGGEARVSGPTAQRTDPKEKGGRFFPVVNCRSCFAEAWGVDFDESGSTAIQKWNRRAPSQPPALHDELRARHVAVLRRLLDGDTAARAEKNPILLSDEREAVEYFAALSMPASEAVDAPDDATSLEVVEHFLHVARTMKPVGQWPGERLCVAIERLINGPRNFIAEADKSPCRASSSSTSRG